MHSPESVFLEKLFAAFESSGIRYAVMRNHDPLPHGASGSDLDLLVPTASAVRAREVLKRAIREADGEPIGISESPGLIKICAFGRALSHEYPWWGLRVDVNVGLRFRGQALLDDAADWPVFRHNGIPVLEKDLGGVLGVLKELLFNDRFPARYAAAARQAAAKNWGTVSALLAPMGSLGVLRLHRLLLSESEPVTLRQECRSLRADILRHAFQRDGLRAVWSAVLQEKSKISRYLNPSGFVVAILGVDGAGKSTLISAVLPALQSATHGAVVVLHLRPTLLPPLARLKGKVVNQGPVTDPHGGKPSGLLGSVFRLLYLTADYLAGYWLRVRPRISKQPTVVLFDRYAYDLAMDPRRFRIDLSSRLCAAFAALAPKPDLIICVHGEPSTIHARKMELSLEETARQVETLLRFAQRNARAVVVRSDCDITRTRDEVLGALQRALSRRAMD